MELRRMKKKNKKKRIRLVTVGVLGLILLMMVILGGFIVYILVQNYHIDESKLTMREASILYDEHGNEVTRLFVENREYISLDKIPIHLLDAFIAIEDQRFYDHRGFDLRAIGRAIYRDILARSLVEGGSTITQQLARNVFLTNEKKLMRKTEEVLIAIKLERNYSKDEILEMYLNYINFGRGAYGIVSAAQIYFDKEVDELTLGEMAQLAAIPKGPGLYSPLIEGNEERSEARRKTVLAQMLEQGRITAEEYELAVAETMEFSDKGITQNPALDTYVDMVMREAQEKYHITNDDLLTGGYQIHTTLNLTAQEAMYEAMHADSHLAAELFPPSGPNQIVQGSMVIMDHQLGGIKAVMGGRDYVRKGINRATVDARSPGSSFKPIAAYIPAIELGWHPYDLLRDEQMSFGSYTPRNYDNRYRGRVTMIDAVKDSVNVSAVWLLNEIGIDKGAESVQKFGFTNFERQLGMALGGGVQVSPLGMARAYGALGNHGVMMEPYLIEQIIDRDGRVVAQHQQKYEQIVSAQTAWYMTRVLERVVKDGTARRVQLAHDVAGKTGTVQSGQATGGARDAWFIGYTPQYSAAVWIGFDITDQDHVMNTSGGHHPALIFNYVMGKMLENEPPQRFTRPSGVQELEPPLRFEPIQDLTAQLRLREDLSLAVDLDFTANADERIAYRIYTVDPETEALNLIADVRKNELINGRGWTHENVEIQALYHYVVIPYNPETGREGDASNVAAVRLFRIPGEEFDPDDDFDRWLEELEREYNRYLDEQEGVRDGEEDELEEQDPHPDDRDDDDPADGDENGGNEEDDTAEDDAA
jgi:penicillin-binding protein 2A